MKKRLLSGRKPQAGRSLRPVPADPNKSMPGPLPAETAKPATPQHRRHVVQTRLIVKEEQTRLAESAVILKEEGDILKASYLSNPELGDEPRHTIKRKTIRNQWFREPPKKILPMVRESSEQRERRKKENQRFAELERRAEQRRRQNEQMRRRIQAKEQEERQQLENEARREREAQLRRVQQEQARREAEQARQRQLQFRANTLTLPEGLNQHQLVQHLLKFNLGNCGLPMVGNLVEQLKSLRRIQSRLGETSTGSSYYERGRQLERQIIEMVGSLLQGGQQEREPQKQGPKEGMSSIQMEKLAPARIARCPMQECAVCLLEVQKFQEFRQMPCRHMFHRLCIDEWLKKTNRCPKCRAGFQ